MEVDSQRIPLKRNWDHEPYWIIKDNVKFSLYAPKPYCHINSIFTLYWKNIVEIENINRYAALLVCPSPDPQQRVISMQPLIPLNNRSGKIVFDLSKLAELQPWQLFCIVIVEADHYMHYLEGLVRDSPQWLTCSSHLMAFHTIDMCPLETTVEERENDIYITVPAWKNTGLRMTMDIIISQVGRNDSLVHPLCSEYFTGTISLPKSVLEDYSLEAGIVFQVNERKWGNVDKDNIEDYGSDTNKIVFAPSILHHPSELGFADLSVSPIMMGMIAEIHKKIEKAKEWEELTKKYEILFLKKKEFVEVALAAEQKKQSKNNNEYHQENAALIQADFKYTQPGTRNSIALWMSTQLINSGAPRKRVIDLAATWNTIKPQTKRTQETLEKQKSSDIQGPGSLSKRNNVSISHPSALSSSDEVIPSIIQRETTSGDEFLSQKTSLIISPRNATIERIVTSNILPLEDHSGQLIIAPNMNNQLESPQTHEHIIHSRAIELSQHHSPIPQDIVIRSKPNTANNLPRPSFYKDLPYLSRKASGLVEEDYKVVNRESRNAPIAIEKNLQQWKAMSIIQRDVLIQEKVLRKELNQDTYAPIVGSGKIGTAAQAVELVFRSGERLSLAGMYRPPEVERDNKGDTSKGRIIGENEGEQWWNNQENAKHLAWGELASVYKPIILKPSPERNTSFLLDTGAVEVAPIENEEKGNKVIARLSLKEIYEEQYSTSHLSAPSTYSKTFLNCFNSTNKCCLRPHYYHEQRLLEIYLGHSSLPSVLFSEDSQSLYQFSFLLIDSDGDTLLKFSLEETMVFISVNAENFFLNKLSGVERDAALLSLFPMQDNLGIGGGTGEFESLPILHMLRLRDPSNDTKSVYFPIDIVSFAECRLILSFVDPITLRETELEYSPFFSLMPATRKRSKARIRGRNQLNIATQLTDSNSMYQCDFDRNKKWLRSDKTGRRWLFTHWRSTLLRSNMDMIVLTNDDGEAIAWNHVTKPREWRKKKKSHGHTLIDVTQTPDGFYKLEYWRAIERDDGHLKYEKVFINSHKVEIYSSSKTRKQ